VSDADGAGFVPAEFDVPAGMAGDGFRLTPLGPEHNAADYEAWTSSIDHVRATPGFAGSSWPTPMTPDENRRDLQGHRDDFDARRGFTYTVLDARDVVVGCLYIYPSDKPGVDADVKSWVRADRSDLDRPLWAAVTTWLRDTWPFTSFQYAERDPDDAP